MTPLPPSARVAVVGGGIAGLSAARHLLVTRPDVAVTVLEGATALGGKLRLGELAGVAVDLGAESALARRPEMVELAGAVGLADAVVHPATTGAGVWTRGAVRRLPPTLMGIPSDLAAAVASGIVSEEGAARAAREDGLPPVDLTDDVAVGALVAERLGPEIRDLLVEPLLGGVYAGRSDELSLKASLPQLAAGIDVHGSLLAAARAASSVGGVDGGPVFAGLAGGMGRLAREVAADVVGRGGVVRVGAMVRELTRGTEGWRLVVGPTAAAEALEFDAVVVATPATAAARLLADAAPAAAVDLAAIEYASMAVVSLAFDTARLGVALDGTGFLVPPVEGHTIKAATYSSSKWAWQAGPVTVVRCSIGRWRDEHELQRDDAELVALALADLRSASEIAQVAPLDTAVTRWGGALPQYAVGHLDRVRRIRDAVATVAGLEICGAAFQGVGIPAVIADAHDAATRVAASIGGAGTMRV